MLNSFIPDPSFLHAAGISSELRKKSDKEILRLSTENVDGVEKDTDKGL